MMTPYGENVANDLAASAIYEIAALANLLGRESLRDDDEEQEHPMLMRTVANRLTQLLPALWLGSAGDADEVSVREAKLAIYGVVTAREVDLDVGNGGQS